MGKERGHGIQLQMGDGAGTEVFTTIAQVESLTPVGFAQGTEPVPTHDDTAGSGIEKLADALYDGGQVQATILEDLGNATHDGSTGLRSKKGQSSSTNFKIIYPNSLGTVDFAAFVVEYRPQAIPANNGKIRTDVTLEIDGDTTLS